MNKLNRMISGAKREALLYAERKQHKELIAAIGRMTTDQVKELAEGEPTDDRIKEIFESVGSLHLLKAGE